MDTKEELFRLPKHWGFVAVQNKDHIKMIGRIIHLNNHNCSRNLSQKDLQVSVFAVELLQVVCFS